MTGQNAALFPEENTPQFSLGGDLHLRVKDSAAKKIALLYRKGNLIKMVNLSDKVAKKLFVVETVEFGAMKSYLATALQISRQTVDNYIETHKRFGVEGLVQGYTVSDSKNIHKQRSLHRKHLPSGNKARQTTEMRYQDNRREEEKAPKQLTLNMSFDEEITAKVEPNEQPFSENHDWEATRYAGCSLYYSALISEWGWLQSVIKYFGSGWKIFAVFMLMSALNIRSIEQLKNTRFREVGIVLGMKSLPSKSKIWEWFYSAADLKLSSSLLKDYFQHQIKAGLVGLWTWFSDGHLLPYTGKFNVHHSYSTQRQRPVPGRTNQVVCDNSGRIVDFVIEEGKGQMKEAILATVEKWLPDLPARPVMVFDREGYDAGFFSRMIKADQPFVTWDKHVNSSKLSELDEGVFSTKFTFNEKEYAVFEVEKSFTHKFDDGEIHSFKLRHIHIWNKKSNRRTCGLAFSEPCEMDLEECTKAILSRWAASENTFKHMQNRHPFHYHPGFRLSESEKQDIANPEIKTKETVIKRINKSLSKLYKKLSMVNQIIRQDGNPRANSSYDSIKNEIDSLTSTLKQEKEEKKQLPERVDVSNLEDYKSFKTIDNEGKNLFDFVTTSVWNARKQMSDWLREYYDHDNELIDLFYAITYCHGWVKSTDSEIVVRLEPLQSKKRRIAQEQLCRKLTSLGAQMPNGKQMVLEVGESPLRKVCPKN